jgi:hypothetical protein
MNRNGNAALIPNSPLLRHRPSQPLTPSVGISASRCRCPIRKLQDWSRIADVADFQLGIADEMRTEQRDRFEAGGCLCQPRNAPLRAYNVFHPLRLRLDIFLMRRIVTVAVVDR